MEKELKNIKKIIVKRFKDIKLFLRRLNFKEIIYNVLKKIKKQYNKFTHLIREIKRNKNIKYIRRYVLFITMLILIFILALVALIKSLGIFETETDINIASEKAIYVFNPGTTSFNLDLNGIIPSDDPYIYEFSISNFKDNKTSDVDMSYSIQIVTTTNLPLTYKLYYNTYTDNQSIINYVDEVQDEDDAWYKKLIIENEFILNYSEKTTHKFYLSINYPSENKAHSNYADLLENVEIVIKSKQIIE